MDSPVMQIKKMKDVGQQLYNAHTSDGCSPATMSPKALGAHRTARAQRPEPPGLMYAGSEAEATLTTLATCAKCKGVQEIPIHELKKTQRADKYICLQCTLSLAPTAFSFGSGNSGSLRGNQAQLAPGSGSNKFKVRNFKPGKYYCDKCRFSTKDPLQYKKHITQHDEIRFICSHCSYVSYTKGEFQRHLVKHTGIFPYQCEYCDYGAVRNDYIVKHRKRVHERAGSRRPPGPTTKLEARRAGTAKPYPELGKSPGPRREMMPSRLPPPLSKFPTHPRRDKAHGSPWLPDPKDLQKDVVCIPKRLGLAEPSEAALFENKSVEVEVLSPAREPLQPGMPLTVVAPSELVVPANCLAQLMDVKMVNGTQQVLLKLFPLEEGSALEARPADGEVGEQGAAEQGAVEQGAMEQGVSEPRKGGAAEPTVPPVGDGRVERLAAGMRSLPVSLQKRLRSMTWLRPYDLLMSQPGPSEPPLAPEGLQERSALCPYQAALPSLASKGPFPPPSVVKNSVFCGLGGGPSPFPYRATAAALSEERQHPPRDSKRLLPLSPPPLALPFSGEQAPLPRSKGDMESRRKLGVPGKGVPSGRKLKDSPMELSTGSGRKLKDSLTEPSMGSGWKLKDGLMEPSVGSGRKLKDSLMEPSVGSSRKLKDSLMEPSTGSGRKLKDGPMEPSVGSGRKLKDGLMEPSLGSGWKLKDNSMEPSMSSGRKLKNGPMEPSMGSGWKLKHGLTEPSAGTGRKLKDGPTEPSTSTGWKLKDSLTEPSIGSPWKLMDGLMESSAGSGWKLTDSLMEPSVGSGWKLTDSLMEPSVGSGWKLKDGPIEASVGSGWKLKDGPIEASVGSGWKLKDGPTEPSAGSGWKLKDGPMEPSMVPAPAQCLSEHLQISLAGEETAMAPQPGDGPLELTTAEKLPDSFEGPVISSVFSLSSGSEDVPEGIRWGSSTAKVKSVELLRRKIAKLIESCGGLRGHPTGPSKALSKATPEKTPEVSMSVAGPSHASVSPPAPPDVPAVEGPSLHTQVQPQPASGSGKAEGRGGRRTRAATPMSAPKGTVLRVQDSLEDAHIMEATCDTSGTIPHSEAQPGKPASSRPTRQTEADLQCPASEGRPGGLAPTPDTSLRPKPRKESTTSGVSPRRNGTLGHGPQGLGDSGRHRKLLSRSLPPNKNKGRQGSAGKKKGQGQAEIGRALKDPSIFQVARQLRLVAAKPDQLIKCPRRNQPVIVLNHPDVDSPEVTNVMKVINKYKGNVLKVVLSERTRCQLGIRRHHVRLTYQNAEEANQIKRQMMLKMKLKKVHKNNYQVVDALPDDAAQCLFKCWFCGRLYEDQEEWMSHGQRHLIEATRDWDVLSSKSK